MYSAYITTIRNIRKHENANKLQIVQLFGNNVIVDLSYYEGQRVIYFPSDGQLSEEYARDNNLVKNYVPVSELPPEAVEGKQIAKKNGVDCVNIGGYMDENKRNVTAIRLRGETSDGIILPIETLSKYTDVSKLKDGMPITVLNGHEICRKYIPRKQRSVNGNNGISGSKNKKELKFDVSYPWFHQHVDTQQLAYNQGAFKEGDTCYITLKMHGSSGRTANTIENTKKKRNPILKKVFHLRDKDVRSFKLISGTRRTTLRDYDGGFYGSNAFRKKWHDFFEGKLPKGMEVFYEIVGYTDGNNTIMGRCSNKLVKDKAFQKQYGDETVFSYGCDVGENDIYIYRITMTNEDGYTVEIPWEQVKIIAEKLGCKSVLEFDKFIYTTWEDLMERVERFYDGADPIGKTHIREGVVVRIDNREKFTAYKHKNFNFKVLSNIIKDNVDIDNISDDLLSEL